MRTEPMRVTRRESLRLFSSGLTATAVSLRDRPNDRLPAEKALDRAGLLRLLGTVPVAAPPLATERVEHIDLGDVVREKVTYAVEPGERVLDLSALEKTHPAIHAIRHRGVE